MYHKSIGYKWFSLVNSIVLAIISLVCLLPLVHILSVSFSDSAPANAHLVGLWPKGFTLASYNQTIKNPNFMRALGMGVYRTILGTAITMFLITLAGYALSKDSNQFKARSFYTWFFLITMLFNGGIIPTYILIRNLHLMNTIWALVLPASVAVYSMVLLMNFFRAVPKELEEAAIMDGAGHLTTLLRIYLPISMPAIATMSLFSIVGNWNAWFDGLLYINNYRNYPLATFLQTVIVQQDFSKINPNVSELQAISTRTVKASQIFIGILPVIVVYPYLQKYFVKGIVLGAVKS